MNTLSAMSESAAMLSQKRPVELHDAPSAEDAPGVPILFILATRTAILMLAVLVIAYLIGTFVVVEAKALWSRGRGSVRT
jgi:hypothetical protein